MAWPERHPRVTAFDGRTLLFAAGGMMATGLLVAINAKLTVAAVLGPLLLAVALASPETMLALFITAGIYKQHPLVMQLIPFDITICIAVVLFVAIVFRVLRRPVRFPTAIWLLAPIVVMLTVGLLDSPSDYGAEKATRFMTLTLLAIVASVLLLDRREPAQRFLTALGILGLFMSISAIGEGEANEIGRLTLAGSSPIALGRIGALAFAFAWLRFHFARTPVKRSLAAAAIIVSLFCVLNSGSRGPTASVLAALLVVSFVTSWHHGRSPVGLLPLLTVAGLSAILVSVVALPYIPLYRFELLFSENKGASILARGVLFAIAWKLTLQHPLGIGVGGFDRQVPLDLRYPHNLLLEVSSELGWVPAVALIALMVCSLVVMYEILKREYSWPAMFLAIALITVLLNSMVSGDLNDNRLLFALLLVPFVYRRFVPDGAHSNRAAGRTAWIRRYATVAAS